jgi:hypothetical protein
MTDRALVEKKLATIVSAVSDLRRLARIEVLRQASVNHSVPPSFRRSAAVVEGGFSRV